MFDDETRDGARPQHGAASATRSPAAASRSTRRSAPSARCCATSSRSRRTSPSPRHQPAPLLRRARATRRRSSRPPPRRRPSCSCNLDTHLRRAARGRAAVHPGLDHRRPAAARHRDPHAARSSGRSCATPRACSAELRPGAAALRTYGADDRRRARGGHARAPAHAAVQPPARARCSTSCRRSPRTRWCRAGSTRPTEHAAHRSNPTLAFLDAGPDRLQLRRRCGSATSRSLLSEGDAQRHVAALHHHRHAAGAQQRGRPVVGAGQRADARQPPPHEPVPEHGGAGSAAGVRGGQRAVRRGPDGHRQLRRARQQASDGGRRPDARAARRAAPSPSA